jgi:hypothetical protein
VWHLPSGTPRDEITAHVVTALSELNNSVSFDALPDMAARLAEHRLQSQP